MRFSATVFGVAAIAATAVSGYTNGYGYSGLARRSAGYAPAQLVARYAEPEAAYDDDEFDLYAREAYDDDELTLVARDLLEELQRRAFTIPYAF